MARWALLLLAVFAVGFLLGRLTVSGERADPRAPAPGRHPVPLPTPGEQPGASTAGAPPAAEAAPREVPETSADVVAPGPVVPEADADSGILEVDFTGWGGERTAFVGWRNARGGEEVWDESPGSDSESTARFELTPGTFDVWWLDPEDGRRRGTRAQVKAGRLTTVRVSDHRTAPPVPEGLGLLDLHVAASWGGGMLVDVVVGGFPEDVELGTNGQGWASVALVPGRYSVRVGDQRSEAIVEEGRATLHRVRHRDEGDLLVEAPDPRHDIRIVPAGAELEPGYPERQWSARAELIFPYVAAGDYDVYYLNRRPDTLGVHLGTVTVHAGRPSRFRYELPRGGLALRVIEKEPRIRTSWWATVRPLGRSGGVLQIHDTSPDVAHHVVLAPGRYAVEVIPNSGESRTREVDVGDSMVPVSFDLAMPAR